MVGFIMAGLIAVLGYLVKAKQWTWIIAGYNTSSKEAKAKYDEKALCHGMGNFLYGLAVTLFLPPLGEWLDIQALVTAGWVLFVLLILGFLIYANTGGRFLK